VLIMSSSSLFSQQNLKDKNGWKQGFWRSTSRHGKIVVECNYLNDTLTGSYKRFFKREIAEESNYKHGVLDGPSKLYWGHGVVMLDIKYANGFIDGTYYAFDEKGRAWKRIEYKHGLIHGKYLSFINGKKLNEASFAYGILDGKFFSYYQNGQVCISIIFRDGRLLSGERTYSKNGKMLTLKLPNLTRDKFVSLTEYDKNGVEKLSRPINEKPITSILFGEEAHKSGELPLLEQE
jgi:antitoxin component YwqK of YwqJK toxin-antitoxin module